MFEDLIARNVAREVLKAIRLSKVECGEKRAPTPTHNSVGLNIRIPFCRGRCPFCLFAGSPARREVAQLYFKGVRKELAHYSRRLGGITISSVYFSGGTPTLFPDEVAELVKLVKRDFAFDGDVSVEASPTDLNDGTFRKLIDAGVTKISIGVQSFDDDILKVIGRNYDGLAAIEAVRGAKTRFDYVNVDLMFCLPSQDLTSLSNDLDTAISLDVEGVSTYPLMTPPYTPLSKLMSEGRVKPPGASEKEMYSLIVDKLMTSGYQVRAVWSFSTRPESYCGPFEFEEYIGVGPGAWFFIGNALYFNVPLLEEYLILAREGLPLFLVADFKKSDPVLAWVARQLYHARIDIARARERFGQRGEKKVKRLLHRLRLAGLVELRGDEATLTTRGLVCASSATRQIVTGLLTMLYEASERRFGQGVWI